MPSVKAGHLNREVMKKLFLFSLLCISIPALAMQPVRFTAHDAALRNAIRQQGPIAIELIQELLPSGIDLNKQDNEGRTAIWFAALEGKNDIYDFLLAQGVNPDIRSTSGDWAGYSARELHELDREDIEETRSGSKLKLP